MDIVIKKAEDVKCPRCWHVHEASLNFDNLCNKCVNIILTDFPNHPSVPFIQENLKQRGLAPQDNPHK